MFPGAFVDVTRLKLGVVKVTAPVTAGHGTAVSGTDVEVVAVEVTPVHLVTYQNRRTVSWILSMEVTSMSPSHLYPVGMYSATYILRYDSEISHLFIRMFVCDSISSC